MTEPIPGLLPIHKRVLTAVATVATREDGPAPVADIIDEAQAACEVRTAGAVRVALGVLATSGAVVESWPDHYRLSGRGLAALRQTPRGGGRA